MLAGDFLKPQIIFNRKRKIQPSNFISMLSLKTNSSKTASTSFSYVRIRVGHLCDCQDRIILYQCNIENNKSSVSWSLTLVINVDSCIFISERTHTPITLKILVNIWCLFHLYIAFSQMLMLLFMTQQMISKCLLPKRSVSKYSKRNVNDAPLSS